MGNSDHLVWAGGTLTATAWPSSAFVPRDLSSPPPCEWRSWRSTSSGGNPSVGPPSIGLSLLQAESMADPPAENEPGRLPIPAAVPRSPFSLPLQPGLCSVRARRPGLFQRLFDLDRPGQAFASSGSSASAGGGMRAGGGDQEQGASGLIRHHNPPHQGDKDKWPRSTFADRSCRHRGFVSPALLRATCRSRRCRRCCRSLDEPDTRHDAG